MSQKKVDAYKEAKKTRKQDVQKEKRLKKIGKIAGWCLLCAVIGGLVVGVVFTVINQNKADTSDDMYTETEYNIPDYAYITDSESEESTEEESKEEESKEESSEEEEPSESAAE